MDPADRDRIRRLARFYREWSGEVGRLALCLEVAMDEIERLDTLVATLSAQLRESRKGK